jgi:hypothetical protein
MTKEDKEYRKRDTWDKTFAQGSFKKVLEL